MQNNNLPTEIEKLLTLDYQQIVDYLLNKYGPAKYDYMTKNWNPSGRSSRGKEGLYLHHIDEDKAIMLSTKSFAMMHSFDYQKAERLVYCNLLEHLILHIKITELDYWDGDCGIGGVYNYIIPELNDIYSGIEYEMAWKQKVVEIVKPLEEDYWKIIFHISKLQWAPFVFLMKSFNKTYYKWNDEKNKMVYDKLKSYGFLDNNCVNKNYAAGNLSISIFNEIEIENDDLKEYLDVKYDNSNSRKHSIKSLSFKKWLTFEQNLNFVQKVINKPYIFFVYQNNKFKYYDFIEKEKYLNEYNLAKNDFYFVKEEIIEIEKEKINILEFSPQLMSEKQLKFYRKMQYNNAKQKAKNLAEEYFNKWNNKNDSLNIETHKYLTLKNENSIETYFNFIIKITVPKWYFFEYKTNFKYYAFNEYEYDKYEKIFEKSKNNNSLCNIEWTKDYKTWARFIQIQKMR